MSATVNVDVIKMSDKQPNTLGDQARLSERLQLLDKLGYPGLQGVGPYGNDLEEIRDHEADAAIRALDAIAIMLTTGAPGEVFATAFDKHQGFTLILAKSSPVSSADEQAVRSLVEAIADSTTEDANDIFLFMFSRCRTNIEKRITRMREAMTAFSPELKEILKGYEPSLVVEEELPASDQYREWKYSGGELSTLQIIHDILADIMTSAQVFNSGNANLSAAHYMELAMMAATLQKSRLLRWLRDPTNWSVRRPWSPRVEKLNRCLTKACQHYHGINELIGYAKRYFPDGVSHRWVNAPAGTEETTVELGNNYLQMISCALGSPLTDEQITALHNRFPDLEERWRNSCLLETRVHPEISIILHLSSTPLNPSDLRRRRPIGLSKRACLCCTVWITTYNRFFPGWLMSRTDGKADPTWALPGCSYAHAIVNDNGKSITDAAVWRAVENRMTHRLQSLFPVMPEPESDLERRNREASERVYARALTDCFGEKQGLMKRVLKQFKRKRST
ncbi:hypothetical protein EDC04DRAFT_332518 [Pisolithus marmoratus]|nr:hypothetical protein EDC04DRAFT_332518 [Pisolithus marmoratus]